MIPENVVHFAEYQLQIIALAWMAIFYSIKVFQLARLPMQWEKGPRKGNAVSGIVRSYSAIFMPWSMSDEARSASSMRSSWLV